MKRLIHSLLTTGLLASSLLAGPALADRKDRGERGGGEREYRAEREYRGGGGNRGRDYREDRGQREWRQERYDPRARAPSGGRWGDDGPRRGYAYPEPPAYSRSQPPPGYGLRRGGMAPPSYRGAIVPDYGRHRLRPPPPGFAWVRAGDRYLLVSRQTGQIFDIIGE